MSCSSTLRVPSLPPPHRHLPPPPPPPPHPLYSALFSPLLHLSEADLTPTPVSSTFPSCRPFLPSSHPIPGASGSHLLPRAAHPLFPEAGSILLGICYLIAYYKPALLITVVYCLSSQHWSALLSSCPLSLAQCWVHSRASRSDSME